MTAIKKTKVLVVDDSALIRKTLSEVISSFDDFEVIGTAADPYIAVHKMKLVKPDVITLDIQMPRMDGITFLKKIMNQHPIPVIVISSLTSKDSETALAAYKAGAIDVIEKPVMTSELKHKEWRYKLYESIITAANSQINQRVLNQISKITNIERKQTLKPASGETCKSIILIGSSAGGTEVINSILSNLDQNTAPILIVQHMPSQFTKSYADRLNHNSALMVKEAVSGDKLANGIVLLAPGDLHMELKNNGFNFFVKLSDQEKVNRHRPSVDVLFNSASEFHGTKMMGIILSGMGKDGANGLLQLKNNDSITIAQSQDSCIVYGMPREAMKIGAASHSLSIDRIIQAIKDFSSKFS